MHVLSHHPIVLWRICRNLLMQRHHDQSDMPANRFNSMSCFAIIESTIHRIINSYFKICVYSFGCTSLNKHNTVLIQYNLYQLPTLDNRTCKLKINLNRNAGTSSVIIRMNRLTIESNRQTWMYKALYQKVGKKQQVFLNKCKRTF